MKNTKNINVKLMTASTLFAALFASAPLMAVEQGDILVRARIINIAPNVSSDDDLDIDSATTLDIDFTYMVTNNFGVELLLDLSSKHDITSGGTKIGDVVVLPPALIAQWHFMPNNNIRPYAGAGINYTMFFSESTESSVLGNTDLSVDDAFGLVAQAGVDIDINKDWYVNFDAKYIDLDTDATLSGDVNGSVSFDINPLVLGVGVGTKF